MHSLRRHIAVYLVGILVFPTLFQPLHVVNHYQRDHHDGHECHHDHGHVEAEAHLAYDIIETEKGHCYICDFEFSVNELPGSTSLGSVFHRFVELPAVLAVSVDLPELPCSARPRAPPVPS